MHNATRNRRIFTLIALTAILVLAPWIGEALAQEKVLNLYTARHYATDEVSIPATQKPRVSKSIVSKAARTRFSSASKAKA